MPLSPPQPLAEDWHPADAPMVPREKRGINEAWVHQGQFIKHAGEKERFIEPAVSRIFQTLKVPHIPVRYAHRAGFDLLHSDYHPDLRSLNAANPVDVEKLARTPARVPHTLLSEWVASVADRHGENYAFHPQHGLLSLDHGYSLGHNPGSTPHVDVTNGTLWGLARQHMGLRPTTVIPEKAVGHVLAHEPELLQHALVGYGHDAKNAMKERLDFLRSKDSHRWMDLVNWTDEKNDDSGMAHMKGINEQFKKAQELVKKLRGGG